MTRLPLSEKALTLKKRLSEMLEREVCDVDTVVAVITTIDDRSIAGSNATAQLDPRAAEVI